LLQRFAHSLQSASGVAVSAGLERVLALEFEQRANLDQDFGYLLFVHNQKIWTSSLKVQSSKLGKENTKAFFASGIPESQIHATDIGRNFRYSRDMQKRPTLPVALTIAGSDSGAGAGIQADLKTFAALGVHGTSVITAVTAQNPQGVLGVQATEPAMVNSQLAAVFEAFHPQAIKTGMLFSAEVIRAVGAFLRRAKKIPPLIVDPIM